MLAIFIPLDWLRKAKYQKDAERINHIALLSNAQEIPGRDPAHVGDLLKNRRRGDRQRQGRRPHDQNPGIRRASRATRTWKKPSRSGGSDCRG